MKTKALPTALLAAVALTLELRAAEFVVTGPPGLDENSDVKTLAESPLTPLFEQMPLKNRLDMSVVFTNKTGATQTYIRGTVTFRNAGGAAIRTSSLTAAEFVKRVKYSTGGTFASGPRQITFDGYDSATLTAVAWTPAGGLIAGGWAHELDDDADKFLVTKMLLDGSYDTSFDGNGVRRGAPGRANAVAIQSNGRILVAGHTSTDFRVQRLSLDGSPDESFGAGAVRTTSLGATAEAHGVAVDSQGRVVLAGFVQTGLIRRLALVRYLPDGELDTAFSGDGMVITDLSASTSESIDALTIDGSDRPVVAGHGIVGGVRQMLVARYRITGVLDTTFSGDGVVLTPFAGADLVVAHSVVIDGSGRIVVGGAAWQGAAQHFALARFNTSGTGAGSFDATFDTDGQVITDFVTTDNEGAHAVAIDVAGNILSGGHARDTETDYFAVARHDASGALMPAFAGDGKLKIEIEEDDVLAESAGIRSVVPLLLGEFIVGGTAVVDDVSQWVLARYHFDGTPYTTATVPEDAVVTLDLADFPFFTDIDNQPFDGFDPKNTPVSLDVDLQFNGLPQHFLITGIALKTITQNARAYRFPLHDPDVAGATWIAGGGHERGTPHGGSRAQCFHWDVSAVLGDSGIRPGVDPKVLQEFWEDHPSGNYDPGKSYAASELPNCFISWGQPVYAMAGGKVLRATNDREDNFPKGDKTFGDGAGNSVVVDHLNGEYAVYCHMQKGTVTVSAGSDVTMGQPLGLVGNSGSSSGPHIHFGLVDDPIGDDPANPSWSDAQSMPMYFIDAKFPVVPGGSPAVRQLRAAPRDNEIITIDSSFIPIFSPGINYGPGLVGEIAGAHDSVVSPQRLVTPVTVLGSIGSTPGTAMADGGDIIEDVYRFTVSTAGTVWVRLEFPASHDLDVLLYDAGLHAINPTAGKSLARPESFAANVTAGVYYVCVTRYDPSGNAPVDYTLHLGAWTGGRDIQVDWYSACPQPFGNPVCAGGWGGPFPTVKQGHDFAFPGCRLFIRSGNYPESVVLRQRVVVRSYEGTAVINP